MTVKRSRRTRYSRRRAHARRRFNRTPGQVGINETNPIVLGPTEIMWEDLCTKARQQRKGLRKVCEAAGLVLVSNDADPKARASWVIPVEGER